jgi:FixJ family two-component response regulator
LDRSGTQVIAIVDDDASLRRSLRNLLTSVGLRAEGFASAEAFLASPHRESTGCMVLDLRMGGMSGLELLTRLASIQPRLPVIVLTGHGDEAARRQCLEAGAVAFLEKPFHSDILVEAIRRGPGRDSGAP